METIIYLHAVFMIIFLLIGSIKTDSEFTAGKSLRYEIS